MNNSTSNSLMSRARNASTGSKILGFFVVLLVILLIVYLVRRLQNDYNNVYGNSPWVISGTKTANSRLVIPGQNIKRSIDSKYGIEFSYTFWMYINNWGTKAGQLKHILHKGNSTANPLQAPGIWLDKNENTLLINMNTFAQVKETCNIKNIPVHKWVHVTVVLMGRNLDVYINGRLKRRCTLQGVPKQNYGDLYVSLHEGFDGFLSRMRYFNYAIPYYLIEKMFNDGPSSAKCIDTGNAVPPYLRDDYWMTTGWPDSELVTIPASNPSN